MIVQNQSQADSAPGTVLKTADHADAKEFPVREYIGAMAMELAQMARWDGDEALAVMLEAANDRASTSIQRSVVERDPGPSRARPA